MWNEYKGIKIYKTFRHGYSYYRIEGQKDLFTTLKAAKAEIDRR